MTRMLRSHCDTAALKGWPIVRPTMSTGVSMRTERKSICGLFGRRGWRLTAAWSTMLMQPKNTTELERAAASLTENPSSTENRGM